MKLFSLLLFFSPTMASAFVIGPTIPGKWGDPTFGTGATISYSFMATEVNCFAEGQEENCTALDDFMPKGYKTEIERAFASWSAVANLDFSLIADDSRPLNRTTNSGDIRFGGHNFDGPGRTIAHGFFPPANGNSIAGDIHFDSDENWTLNSADTGINIFLVALHEIGHALGLSHEENFSTLAVMNPVYNPSLTGLQADDIAGIQTIYGAAVVPIPAAIWLFGSGVLGMIAIRKKQALIKT